MKSDTNDNIINDRLGRMSQLGRMGRLVRMGQLHRESYVCTANQKVWRRKHGALIDLRARPPQVKTLIIVQPGPYNRSIERSGYMYAFLSFQNMYACMTLIGMRPFDVRVKVSFSASLSRCALGPSPLRPPTRMD